MVSLFNKNIDENIKVNVIGTGAGDAGSVTIVDKLKVQKESSKDKVDIDVAIVHQIAMKDLIENDWISIMKELKSLPVTYTNGNNGTLDMLNNSNDIYENNSACKVFITRDKLLSFN